MFNVDPVRVLPDNLNREKKPLTIELSIWSSWTCVSSYSLVGRLLQLSKNGTA